MSASPPVLWAIAGINVAGLGVRTGSHMTLLPNFFSSPLMGFPPLAVVGQRVLLRDHSGDWGTIGGDKRDCQRKNRRKTVGCRACGNWFSSLGLIVAQISSQVAQPTCFPKSGASTAELQSSYSDKDRIVNAIAMNTRLQYSISIADASKGDRVDIKWVSTTGNCPVNNVTGLKVKSWSRTWQRHSFKDASIHLIQTSL